MTDTIAQLFDSARHEPLSTTPWRESLAHDAIRRITASAVAAFDPGPRLAHTPAR